MSFDTLGLNADLLKNIARQGYETPTPIQAKAIPAALQGRDLMASAQTGTGKTAAFTLPMLEKLGRNKARGSRHPRAVVLTPTRELAVQVSDSVRDYSRGMGIDSTVIYGGVNIRRQMDQLRRGTDIIIATPGRLMDHMSRRTVDLSQVEILVLDEADRMLDMGFLPAIEAILKTMPKQRQTLLFSATFSGTISKLAQRFLDKPERIETAAPNAAAVDILQTAYRVDGHRKRELLSHLIGSENWKQVLIFTRTKRGADRLSKQLDQDGISSTAIHGDKGQGARNRALRDFKQKNIRALVATDVAARGIDVDHLPYVVNFDIPNNPEDYVHRIGRTGRRGRQGAAVSFIGADEQRLFQGIRRLLDRDIPSEVMGGFEPTAKASPGPDIRNKRKPRRGPPKPRAGGRHRSRSGGERTPRAS
ncbi:ATP-dependent RNA helicase RhlE [Natronospira proteinivora]|uniref:ATP-dependent RNA helicase RhlE n=1 Tax=Natronospira proteinivora TaxID=1807133 RepID=A0ABT1G747_9GAMM|nr:DEAD/DEAH box helicase [Natronospira proteinivora]MCP1727119.1 ATP-dependent RNA helicase RhlE [Natronospira proteinivora]